MTANWVTELVDYSGNVLFRMASDGVKYAGAFFGALALSLVLTPVCREWARRVGMVDKPDERRIHQTPTPRGGGLAVFLVFHLVLGILFLGLGGQIGRAFSGFWQWRFLLASGLLVVVGLVDDKIGLRPVVKLTGQIAVALILYLSGVSVGGIIVAFPPWLDCLVTVFWIVGAINAFNLIDGMDGLATGLALIASVGLAGALLFTGQSALTLPYLVLAGACLGFLRYNFHPASVFLGDTGSMFLGLCVATFPLMTGSRKELVASLGVPMLAMGIPIFDTMLAIWRRSVRALLPQVVADGVKRSRVMQPDKEHVHHRLLRENMNQKTAAITLYAVSLVLVAIGLVGTLLKGRAPGLFLIAFIVAVYVVARHLQRVELWDTGRLLSQRRGTLRQGLLVPLYMVMDVLILCGAWFFARWEADLPVSREACLSDMPMFVVPVFVALVVAKTYWRVWSRAQVRDFATLGVAVTAGTLVGTGMIWLLAEHDPSVFRFAFLFATTVIIPVAGVRLVRDSITGVLHALERRLLMDKEGISRCLIYGGGLRFRSFLRELTERSGMNDRAIVGIVDDDINLKGRIISGYTVLGRHSELEGLVRRWKVDVLIITCVMEQGKRDKLVAEAMALGLRVTLWSCEEVVCGEGAASVSASATAPV